MELRSDDDWPELFRAARESAHHTELRDSYAEPSESEPLRRFLAGDPPPVYDKSDWIDLVRETTGRGVTWTRVRVITVPHSDYQRWLFSVTGENVAAGEDIRYLPRHLAPADVLPSDDWWLFDDRTVAFNLVDVDGRPAGLSVTTDPAIAARCRWVKQRLLSLATPFALYVDEDTVNSKQ